MRIMGSLGTVSVEIKKELDRKCKQMDTNGRRFLFIPAAVDVDSSVMAGLGHNGSASNIMVNL